MEADFRYSPERRVKRRTDFLRIQSSGEKYRSKHFLMAVSAKRAGISSLAGLAGRAEMRFGVTITTKVDKRAARRNRLRRRLRELFRLIRPRLLGEPVDIVVIARSGSVDLNFDQLRREFHYLLYQSKLLRSSSKDSGKQRK